MTIETTTEKRPLTRDDYRALPEGPPYYELVRGKLVERTRASREHRKLLILLGHRWMGYLLAGPGGELLPDPNLFLPGIEEVYHPDFVYVAADRQGICRSEGIFGAPDVICEILSPTTERLDRYVKMADYRRAGVPHAWLLDQRRPVAVEEYILGEDERYRLNAAVQAPAEWRPAAFPGWTVSLAELDAAVAPVGELPPPVASE